MGFDNWYALIPHARTAGDRDGRVRCIERIRDCRIGGVTSVAHCLSSAQPTGRLLLGVMRESIRNKSVTMAKNVCTGMHWALGIWLASRTRSGRKAKQGRLVYLVYPLKILSFSGFDIAAAVDFSQMFRTVWNRVLEARCEAAAAT